MGNRAEDLLEQALDEVRSGIDAIPTVDAALAELRIEAGELDADEVETTASPRCSCPPDLSARGGFRGDCPAHTETSQ